MKLQLQYDFWKASQRRRKKVKPLPAREEASAVAFS
jgi:hypothetical protein